TLDLAGHGDSAKKRQRWTIEAFARDVATVVNHAEIENVFLIGHSLGGPIMLEAASLINARVLGMIGVDTLHNFDPRPMNNEKIDNYLQAYFDNPVKAEEMFHDRSRSDLIKFVDRSREKTGAGIISAAFREMLVYLQS